MNSSSRPALPFLWLVVSLLCLSPARSAVIPGLYNTGINDSRVLLPGGSVDPHWKLVQSADPAFPGPNAIVLNEGYPIQAGVWLLNGPDSKWISPQVSQATGNPPGDYTFRTTFSLSGLEPSTAVITGRWTSDNAGAAVRLNGNVTGITQEGNFGAFSATFTISTGFVDGINELEFVVNNAGTTVNPTGFRAEINGTADFEAPPGTPPSVVTQPLPVSVGLGDGATFLVEVYGSKPLSYQWRLNGTPIPGATSSVLTIPLVGTGDAGAYTVVVNNAFGSVTSLAATLTVVALSPAQLSYEAPGPASRRTGLVISEVMYHPADRLDGRNLEFIEIYNSNPFFEDMSGYRITGGVSYTFPEGTVLQGQSYLVVAPVPGDVAAVYGIGGVLGGFTNRLSNRSDTLMLRKRSGGVVLDMTYTDRSPWPVAADGTGHSLVMVRPSYGQANPRAWAASARIGGSPGGPDPVPVGSLETVVINELLTHTDLPLVDYVELFNASLLPADLSGCFLTDDPATNKFRIPNGTVMGPSGFAVFNETQLGFGLSADGEAVYLVSPDGTRVIAALRFGGQANGVAYGRHPDGGPDFSELTARTPGLANAAPWIRDVVINEIMYHPLSGDNDDEYVELHNKGAAVAAIGGWRFIDGIDYTFPSGTMIPAGGYLVVAANTARMMTNYSGLNAGNLVGGFGGNLSNGGERLALAMPDTLISTNATTGLPETNTFHIVVDEVTYVDGGRWGVWSDGGGSSLELVDPRSDNRQPSNWADSDETGKAPWTVVEHTGVLDNGSGTASELQTILFGAAEVLLDEMEVLVSGANRIPNPGFESSATGWFFQGTHSKSRLETSEGYNSSRSLRVVTSDRGDVAANRVRAPFSTAPANGQTATIRAKVRWLRGFPEIVFRMKGNYLEAFGRLDVPRNLGTPGAPNSMALVNAGPAISEVGHRPLLPQANEAVRVSARIADPNGLSSATLVYRIDGLAGTFNVPMVDDGTGGDALANDGVYTGLVPGQAAGRLIAFHVRAEDGATPAATALFPDNAPTRECLVRVGAVHPAGSFGAYHLWLTTATVNTWAGREKLSNENLDGTFVYGTNRVVYNVGAHYSGSPYTSPGYTSPVGALCGYDIIFPEDEPFLNSAHVVLDWPVRDNTNQREQLMYWFLEQYGLPNMYRRYVIMYVNGVKRGTIYDDVQQPNGDTIEEWFGNDTEGALFKTDCWDEFNANGDRETGCIDLNALELYTTTDGEKKTARYRWVWKPRSVQGTANDYSKLFDLVDAATAPDANYRAGLESVADMEHWMRTFAMNDLASFWDAFGNPNAKNTHLYKPERDRWKLICWDLDVGLGVFNDPVNAALFPTLNDDGMNRIYANPAWTRLYWSALQEGVNGFFQTGPGTAIDAILDAKFAAFQASGISLTDPAGIKSWISQRRAFLLTQLATVTAVFGVSNGDPINTGQNLVTLTGTAPVAVQTLTVNGVAYTPRWTTVTQWVLQVPVTSASALWVIEGFDRFGNLVNGASRALTVNYSGALVFPEDHVVINEIMYAPSVPDAEFLEIHNTSTVFSFDLSGWRVNGIGYTFPPGSVLTNGQYLVLVKNRWSYAREFGASTPVFDEFDGNLDNGGETLTLLRPGAAPGEELVVDRVSYDDAPPWPQVAGRGLSLQLIDARQDNARVGNWAVESASGPRWQTFTSTQALAGSANSVLFALNAPGELYMDNIELVLGSEAGVGPNLIANGGLEIGVLAPWVPQNNHSNTMVSTEFVCDGSYSLKIIAAGPGSTVDLIRQSVPGLVSGNTYTFSFRYLPTAPNRIRWRVNGFFSDFNVGLEVAPLGVVVATPGKPNTMAATLQPFAPVWLNELQAENLTGITDVAGDRDPWIELVHANPSGTAQSLDGYYLANNFSNLTQWPFPAGATMQPGEFKLVWADGEPGEGTASEWHAGFRLAPGTGAVALSRMVDGLPQVVDYMAYSNLQPDRSFGSFPDGNPFFRQPLFFTTPGTTNNPALPPVPLFINEWMASNTGSVTDPADQDFDDWFELYNAGTERVDLTDYRLTDDGANPTKYRIPAGFSIGPGEFLLVWADEEGGQTTTNGEMHVSFKLGASGEEIRLYAPNGQLVDAVVFGPQTANVSQGRFPDGSANVFFMPDYTPRSANRIRGATAPVITDILVVPGGGNVTLTWSAQSGQVYRVQYKNSLSDANWMNLPGDVTATGASASKTDSNGAGQRFYQVIVP